MKNLKVLFLALLILSQFVFYPIPQAQSAQEESAYKWLNLFGDVFGKVKKYYVEDVDNKQLIESAVSGMLSSLDPHSIYLNEKDYKDMQVKTSGEFGGLGIKVLMDKELVKIISPIFGTPAYKAGLKSGDYITHLDGKSVKGMTINDAVGKMRGKVNTKIVLTVLREGQKPFEVTIVRAMIKEKSVEASIKDQIGYARITTFNAQTELNLKKEIVKIKKKLGANMKGFVLDLRNNPGGLLDQSILVSDVFLDQGEIVSVRSRNPKVSQRYKARSGDLLDGLPLVVLINDGSASASEIVAGAMQDNSRGIILGVRSFGKGSVQTILPMFSGKVALKLTTSRYYTPLGRSIQEIGISPDIIVPQGKLENIRHYRFSEEKIPKALTNEMKDANKIKKQHKEKRKKAEQSIKDDYQLSRALDLIHGIALSKKNKKI